MPIYEYKCPQCDNIFEEWVKNHNDIEDASCPQCSCKAQQIISNTSFVLKGGGWYVTEYGNRKNQENNSNCEPDVSKQKSTEGAVDSNVKASNEAKPPQEKTSNASSNATKPSSTSSSSTKAAI